MSAGALVLQNRQRGRKLDTRLFRRIGRTLLSELLEQEDFEIRVLVVSGKEMARINETYLRHEGITDVITFDYGDPMRPGLLCGDLYICPEEAETQARRFGTTWQSELVRYVVHGVLHLVGYDDLEPEKRRAMKREENRLVKLLQQRFSVARLGSSQKG
ncbi:MAG TPA: rRNA maturation RNase YbeY [Clostridia bacterium]|nr:rRNA maturation RNase YbeY [Clostridia bacterium]